MEEKIKVNISFEVESIISKDMELFEFFKPNGTINKNSFYTTLINNYYEIFSNEEDELSKTIYGYISSYVDQSKTISQELARIITSQKNNFDSENNNISISIKPTKGSKIAIDYINNYLLRDISMSAYYRQMFSSYCSKPQNIREQIIFKHNFYSILKAIKEKNSIYFTTSNGGKYEVSPYKLTSSNEEMFNYLLGQNNKNGQPNNFRMSRINNITILSKPSEFSDKSLLLLNKMIEVGPQYSIKDLELEPIIVELSESGINMFKTSYVNRPKPIKIENNIYTFNCSLQQAFQYFRRFGNHATIISPSKLLEQMKQFYKTANYHYENII